MLLAPLLTSAVFGVAIYLIYAGLTIPRLRQPGQRRLLRSVEGFLRRAGLPDVGPREFLVVSLSTGVVLGGLTELLLGWGILSLLAAGLGASAPFAYYV